MGYNKGKSQPAEFPQGWLARRLKIVLEQNLKNRSSSHNVDMTCRRTVETDTAANQVVDEYQSHANPVSV